MPNGWAAQCNHVLNSAVGQAACGQRTVKLAKNSGLCPVKDIETGTLLPSYDA